MKIANHARTLGLVLCVALVTGVATHALAQSALDDVMKAKEIKIAIPTDFPPYGLVGTDLKPQGLDIDMGCISARRWSSRWSWCR